MHLTKRKEMEQHPDFDLSTIDVRLKSTENYIKYLKHLKLCQMNDEIPTPSYSILQMIIDDLQNAVDIKQSKQ